MWWLEYLPDGTAAGVARGFDGQLIAVVPDRRAVVAVVSEPTVDYAVNSDDIWAMVNAVIGPALR